MNMRFKKKNDKCDDRVPKEDMEPDYFGRYIQRQIDHSRNGYYNILIFNLVCSWPWACLLYVATKWLYVITAFAQLVIITDFVGQSNYLWGFEVFKLYFIL